jgi:predicted nucleic acid-binding protein
MIILDTNVVSVAMGKETDTILAQWLDAHPLESLWLTLAHGRRRRQLEDDFASNSK